MQKRNSIKSTFLKKNNNHYILVLNTIKKKLIFVPNLNDSISAFNTYATGGFITGPVGGEPSGPVGGEPGGSGGGYPTDPGEGEPGGSGGGYPTGALGYIKDHGVPSEKCFSYRAKNSACTPCEDWKNDPYKISNYIHIDTSDYKWALQNYGPMVVVIRVPDDWFYYKAGVYEPVWEDKVGWANHCVVLCGWDDKENAWIIKNSWGKYWGMDGYAYVKYGVLEKYNYGYAIEKPIIPAPSPEPGSWIKPASATASSMYSGAYSPEKAIDGDNRTHWYSKRYQKNNWIQLELNKTAVIDAIRMRVYQSFVPMPVEVQTSIDGKKWKIVANDTITRGNTLFETSFEKTKCRYIQIIEKKQYYGLAMLTEMDVHVCKENAQRSSINLEYSNGSTKVIPFANDLTGITIIKNGTKTLEWWNT